MMAYDPNYTPDDDASMGAIVLGSLIVIAVGALAVAHYGYDVPIYRRHRRGFASPSGIAFTLLTLGVGGTLAICAGFYIRQQR